jgi:type II secretory pathway component PulF
MAVLLESGMPITKAVVTASTATDDAWLTRRCQLMVDQVDSGELADEAARQAGLPNTLIQIFRNTSSTNSSTEALRGLSDIYSAQSFLSSNVMSAMIAPAVMVVVAMFVGLTTLSLFMPLIKLLNDLS